MALASLCLIVSTLTISPDQSQFFEYDSIALRCEDSSWTVKRTTSYQTAQVCQKGWALPKGDTCLIETASNTDTGLYWCESRQGECSNSVNITVTDRPVILEMPPYAVNEGDNVMLRCSYKREGDFWSTSEFSASFYKDGDLIGAGEAGEMTLKILSKAGEGFYKCQHPSKGESMQSWLTVKDKPQPTVIPPTPSPPLIPWTRVIIGALLFILYSVILILCVCVYRKWARA